jgi:hypothetical protein
MLTEVAAFVLVSEWTRRDHNSCRFEPPPQKAASLLLQTFLEIVTCFEIEIISN